MLDGVLVAAVDELGHVVRVELHQAQLSSEVVARVVAMNRQLLVRLACVPPPLHSCERSQKCVNLGNREGLGADATLGQLERGVDLASQRSVVAEVIREASRKDPVHCVDEVVEAPRGTWLRSGSM